MAGSVLCAVTARLSDSWFGTPAQGELCYALRTTARRQLAEVRRSANRAVAPVLVENRSEEMLNVPRLCLNVRHLCLYRAAPGLWTNECQLSYRGGDHPSNVIYGAGAPDCDGEAQLLTAAREEPVTNLFRRSFDTFRRWSAG